jgi:hypothetical protein
MSLPLSKNASHVLLALRSERSIFRETGEQTFLL